MNIGELAEATRGRLLQGDPRWAIARAEVDSRRVQAGDLFVAVQGERTDGHLFIGKAVAAGAGGVLMERPVPLPPDVPAVLVDDVRQALLRAARRMAGEFSGLVGAVTGSVGKTTTKELWAAALAPLGPVFRNPGNFNSDIGMPLALFGLTERHRSAVFELGMRGRGEIARLASVLRPRIGIVTVIGHSHLEILGSVEAIARAKSELLSALPQDGAAVLNADDPWLSFLRLAAPHRVLLVGRNPAADLRIVGSESLGVEGSRLHLAYAGEEVSCGLRLLGHGAVLDAALAVGGALAAGVGFADAAAALSRAEPPHGRLRTLRAHGMTAIDDTYNASPQSLDVALRLLRELPCTGRRIAVLGDMRELGPEEMEMHRQMGRAAAHSADIVLAVGEFAPLVAEAARAEGSEAEALSGVDDVAPWLRRRCGEGDVVLFKASRAIGLEQALALWLEVEP